MSCTRTVSVFSLILALLYAVVAQAQSTSTATETADGNPLVVMRTTMGDITIELEAERAPQTVRNFLGYVDDNFYADTLFHRVIDGFMIQGGGFSTQYQRKTTRPPVSNEAYNGLRNTRYTIAMARTTAPHSATSQFFINTENNRNLDHTDTTQRGWGYTVFGRVIEGQEVVDAISTVRTSAGGPFSRDVPAKPVVILGVERVVTAPAAQPDATGPAEKGDGEQPLPIEPAGGAAAARPADNVIQDATSAMQKTAVDVPNGTNILPSDDIVNQN